MTSDPTPKPETARDRLLNAAAVLFYNRGIGGTGIDAIVARAGVAKKSLYNNFASKADLVEQYIERRHGEWLGLYALRMASATTPKEQVLAVFDAYHDHAAHDYERGFRGCGLFNAAAELLADDPGRQAVRRHKEEVEGLLAAPLTAHLHDPARAQTIARQLAFLLEGAYARAGLEGKSTLVAEGREMAAAFLEGL